jgi:predicted 3-demethylubiquinone-9 3-methyltransferase (glyoxalase superfamily)
MELTACLWFNGNAREAVSFQIPCANQAEIDKYWEILTADGGQESQCG